MAIYPPPIDQLPIFDTTQFENVDSAGNVIQEYVEFPVAQGDVILQDAVVTGTLQVNSTLTAQADLGVSGTLYANTINENTAGGLSIGGNTASVINLGGDGITSSITIESTNTAMNGSLTMGTTSLLTANGNVTLGQNKFIQTGVNTIAPTATQYGGTYTGTYSVPITAFTSGTPKTYSSLTLPVGVFVIQAQGQMNTTTTGGLIYLYTTSIVNTTTSAIEGTNQNLSYTSVPTGQYANSTNAVVSLLASTTFDLTMSVTFDAPSSFTATNTAFIFVAIRIA